MKKNFPLAKNGEWRRELRVLDWQDSEAVQIHAEVPKMNMKWRMCHIDWPETELNDEESAPAAQLALGSSNSLHYMSALVASRPCSEVKVNP